VTVVNPFFFLFGFHIVLRVDWDFGCLRDNGGGGGGDDNGYAMRCCIGLTCWTCIDRWMSFSPGCRCGIRAVSFLDLLRASERMKSTSPPGYDLWTFGVRVLFLMPFFLCITLQLVVGVYD